MAAPNEQNSQVRVRVSISEKSHVIIKNSYPFWLLIKFNECRKVKHVQKKILNILNVWEHTHTVANSNEDQGKISPQPAEATQIGVNLNNKNSKSHHKPSGDAIHSIDTSVVKTYETDAHSSNVVLSCQLWMGGFLLLSNETSEIFQNDDLIIVDVHIDVKHTKSR